MSNSQGNIGRGGWIHIGHSIQGLVFLNTDTAEIAVEDLQSGRLITPKWPVVIEPIDPSPQSTTRKSR